MTRTIEEQKDLLIARCDPDQLIEILEPEIDQLVDACHELIILKQKEVLLYLEETDL
jgi:hypothetical protein